MVTKLATTIETDTFKAAINNAIAIVKLDEGMGRDEFIQVLKNIESKCYRFVPEEALEPFRLPAGMEWSN